MKNRLIKFGLPIIIIWFLISIFVYIYSQNKSSTLNGQTPEGVACTFIKTTELNGTFYSYYEQDQIGDEFYFLGSFYVDSSDKQIKEVLKSIYDFKLGEKRIPVSEGLSFEYLKASIALDLNNSYNALKRACINKYGLNQIMNLNSDLIQ